MEYKSVKGFGGWAQLGFLFAFLGLGVVLVWGMQSILIPKMLPANVSVTDEPAVMKAMLSPQNITMARASQILGTLLLLFVPAVLWSFVSNGRKMFWLGFSKYLNVKQIFIGFLIIFAASIAASPLADLSKSIVSHFPDVAVTAQKMEDLYNSQVLALSHLSGWGEYLMALVIMAFFPAMFEEAFFRGAVQNLFTKWWKMPVLAIFVSACIFSLIHMSIYLFASRLLLGFVLGLLYYKTKNLWVNIIAHFLNNAIAVTQMFLVSGKATKTDINSLDPHVHWSVGIIGIIILYGLFLMLDKASRNKKALIEVKENFLIEKEDPFRSFANAENH